MSDPSDYRDFTHTGPGTLAGRYLRTFWQPVYRSADLAPGYAVPVRIMREDLALYRDEPSPSSGASSNGSAAPTNAGTTHLLSLHCAHRGAPLNVGDVEGTTIRCGYHGWRYDGGGLCVEPPGEDDSTAGTVRLRGYPTREYLGLIFAYLGEGEPPPLRRFPDFEALGVLAAGAPEYWPCNYFNRIDNAPDGGDADVDRLFAIATTSIDESERQRATVALHKRISQVAGYGPLYYSVQMLLARSGVRGPIGNYGPQLGMTWNIFEWEVR